MPTSANHFNTQAADLEGQDVLARARPHAGEIEHFLGAARSATTLLQAGMPVLAHELSGLIDQAEQASLVCRKGMAASGLYYIVHEPDMLDRGGTLRMEEAMTTVQHLFLQAQRAHNILARNSGGYKPRETGPLYGDAVKDWTPLLP